MPEPIATALCQPPNPFLIRFVEDESGQDVIEYALLASMVAFGSVAGTANMAGELANSLTDVSNSLTSATSVSAPSTPTPPPAPPSGRRGRRGGGGNGGFNSGGGRHHRFF